MQQQQQGNDCSFSLQEMERFLFLLAHLFSFVPTLLLRKPGLIGKR